MSISPDTMAQRGSQKWLRLVLDVAVAAALCGALAAVYAFDRGSAPIAELPPPPLDPPPPPPPPPPPSIDPTPRLTMAWTGQGQFGIMTTDDPDDPTVSKKKLTYSDLTKLHLHPDGDTNTTRVWVDGATPLFFEKIDGQIRAPEPGSKGRLVWLWRYKAIEVEQAAELVAGDVSRRMDTIRVTYTLRNRDSKPHEVGLGVVIDTLIGSNDGVLFWVPTRAGMISQPIAFGKGGEEVPPYIRALEKADLKDPGVSVSLGGLRPKDGEAPTEVVLSGWPGRKAEWNYDRHRSFIPEDVPDTAVGLFYAPQWLPPDKARIITFTYGLASHTRRNKLTLDAATAPQAGGEFDLVALIQQPEQNQTVTLDLPDGMSLKGSVAKTQPVKVDGDYTKAIWTVAVAPNARGRFTPRVRLESGSKVLDEAPAELTVYSRLELRAQEKLPGSQPSFRVAAYVLDPEPGQTVTLEIDGVPGLELDASSPVRQDVPHPANAGRYGKVEWSIHADGRAKGEAKLSVVLQPTGGRQEVSIVVEPRTLTR